MASPVSTTSKDGTGAVIPGAAPGTGGRLAGAMEPHPPSGYPSGPSDNQKQAPRQANIDGCAKQH